ncbi:MAG TPA: TadE family protein [Chloroflexota bacterium]|nr:TadE family protein [Chloroflexota bacterium]
MKRLVRSERGSTVAEMALILPVFLLILFGIVEGSVVLNTWMILTNETREAARYAIAGVRDGDTNLVNEVKSHVTSDLSGLLNTGSLTVTVTPTTTTVNGTTTTTAVTVTASYSVALVTPYTQAAMGASVPVTVSSTMRAE